jgi:hypothetical protein
VNVGLAITLFYTTNLTENFLAMLFIPNSIASFLLIISVGACFLGLIYNFIIGAVLT